MRTLNTLFFSLVLVASVFGGNEGRYQKIMDRASSFYEHFSYQKAIDLYMEALELNDTQEVNIQLANCYRMLNKPEESLKWYQNALEKGAMNDEDMLHYGQVLSSLQQYDSAHAVLNKYQHQEEWIEGRAEGFKNVNKFFHNELAYDIQEVIFNSAESDFAPSVTQSGFVFVSGRLSSGLFKPKYNTDKSYFLDLFEVKDGQEPVKFQRGINTRYHEGPSVFYENDTKVIFTRNNYHQHKAGKSEDGVNHLKLFFSEKQADGEWSKATQFEYNSDEYSIGHPTLSSNGKTLYFSSDMPGGEGGVDIYKSYWEKGKWSAPENLGSIINTGRDEMFPFVSHDDFLYFASDGHEGLGGLDIFRVDLTVANALPRNLGFALNTHKDDFAISLSPDGKKGYFSSNREGGTGGDDIYEILIYDFIVTVNLRDMETNELITGDLRVYDEFLDEYIRNESQVSSVKFPAVFGDSFMVNGLATEYIPDSLEILTKEASRDIRFLTYDIYLAKPITASAIVYRVEINGQWQQVMYEMDSTLNFHSGKYEELVAKFEADRVAIDSVIDLRNVLYDFDKHDIRPEAAADLDKWVSFLNTYPDRTITLSAHTDIRGSNKYNERLAKRRVKAAKAYLIDKGIDKDRLVDSSAGEEKLFVDCGEACDDVQHQYNRRTEVLVVQQ